MRVFRCSGAFTGYRRTPASYLHKTVKYRIVPRNILKTLSLEISNRRPNRQADTLGAEHQGHVEHILENTAISLAVNSNVHPYIVNGDPACKRTTLTQPAT